MKSSHIKENYLIIMKLQHIYQLNIQIYLTYLKSFILYSKQENSKRNLVVLIKETLKSCTLSTYKENMLMRYYKD